MLVKESGYHVSHQKWVHIIMDTLPESYISDSTDMLWAVDTERKLVFANDIYLKFIYSMTGVRHEIDEYTLSPDGNQASTDKWDYFYSRAIAGEKFNIITTFASQKVSVLIDANFSPLISDGHILGSLCLARNTAAIALSSTKTHENDKDENSFLSRS